MKTAKEIKRHLRNGDYTKIASAVGVSRKYAYQLLNRPTAEKHAKVLSEARKIAQFNIKMGL